MCGKNFGNFFCPLLRPACWQTRLHALSLLQRYNQHARNVGTNLRLNHALIVGTQLEAANDSVLHVARHPPKSNMDTVMGLSNSVQIRNTFMEALLVRWMRVLKTEVIIASQLWNGTRRRADQVLVPLHSRHHKGACTIHLIQSSRQIYIPSSKFGQDSLY